MEDEKVDNLSTELNADEATLILTLFSQITVKPTDPNAVTVCENVGSATKKLERIVRLSQPLASAARPKETVDAETPVIDEANAAAA